MARILESFSAGCPLRVSFQNEVEAGKCGPCELKIVDVRKPASRELAKRKQRHPLVNAAFPRRDR